MIIRNDVSKSKMASTFRLGEPAARPPDSGLMVEGEKNTAALHFPPLPNLKHQTVTERRLVSLSNQAEVNIYKIWLLV